MKTRFELFKGNNNEWYFRLKSSNGQVVCQSEGYKQKHSAIKGIKSVKKNAGKAGIEEIVRLNVKK